MLTSSFTKDFEMLTYDCISFWRGPDLPFRKLSNSESWQRKYRTSLSSGIPFFSGAVSEFDNATTLFLHFLEFYKNIYDMMENERPPENIIDNCLLCDEWL
jgi:hypothetical protein